MQATVSNKLEQLEFKLEKIIGIKKPTGRLRKSVSYKTIRVYLFTFCPVFFGIGKNEMQQAHQ